MKLCSKQIVDDSEFSPRAAFSRIAMGQALKLCRIPSTRDAEFPSKLTFYRAEPAE